MDFKQTIKTAIISAVVFIIIATIAFGILSFVVISNARANLKTDDTEAINIAAEQAYIYARDNLGYAGSMEMMKVSKEIKELKLDFPFSKCRYNYEFEFLVGYTEIELEVNAMTGKCIIVDIDRLD